MCFSIGRIIIIIIQFDLEKTELIHFHSKRNIGENVNICFLENYLVEAKPTVKMVRNMAEFKTEFQGIYGKKHGAGDQNLSLN